MLIKWGFFFEVLYCVKDIFLVCREVVFGIVIFGILVDYFVIKLLVCCYLNKYSCCFLRNMVRSSKEKRVISVIEMVGYLGWYIYIYESFYF